MSTDPAQTVRGVFALKRPCDQCPFTAEPGTFGLRDSRRQSIAQDLRDGDPFHCHKTTEETGDGSRRVCAGARHLVNQERLPVSTLEALAMVINKGATEMASDIETPYRDLTDWETRA